jgi:hypothetical protein
LFHISGLVQDGIPEFWVTLKAMVDRRFDWFKSRGSVAKTMEGKLLPKKVAAKGKAKPAAAQSID